MSLRNIDLNLLVVFEAIYTAGNISHAAKLLNLTQPTISNSLARLRDTVDDPLFVRAGRGVEPTPKAMQMIGPVRDALRMIQSGVGKDAEFDPASTPRHFRLLLLDQLEPILMPPVVRQIQNYRTVSLEILPFASTRIEASLNDGSLDLALSVYSNELTEFSCERIGKADLVVVSRQGHPKISGELTLDVFAELSQIALLPVLRKSTIYTEHIKMLGIERHIVYTVSKLWSFPFMIANSDLIGVLPGEFARAAATAYPITIHPLPFELPEQNVYMIWKKSREDDAGLTWLREQIVDAYQLSLAEGI